MEQGRFQRPPGTYNPGHQSPNHPPLLPRSDTSSGPSHCVPSPVFPGGSSQPFPAQEGCVGGSSRTHHMAQKSLSYLLAACSWKRYKWTDPPAS